MAETWLLTGASCGIGRAYARALAERKDVTLLLVGRNRARLVGAAKEIGGATELLLADLAEPAQRAEILRTIRERGWQIDGFLHAAGSAQRGPFLARTFDEHRREIEVNTLAPLELVRALLPGMLERGRGEIVVVSSRWAFFGAPFLSTYSASKSFLLRWAAGLAAELSGSGVHVLVQCPGHTLTEGAAKRARIWSWFPARSPEQVARAGLRALARRQTVTVDGWANRLLVAIARCLPIAWASSFLRRRLA